jgi:hypothetical protein
LAMLSQYKISDSGELIMSPACKKSGQGLENHDAQILFRTIDDDFDEPPTDIIPDYQLYVRRVLSLSFIRQRLFLHGYRCWGSVNVDFYVMMNNARTVTNHTSLVNVCT